MAIFRKIQVFIQIAQNAYIHPPFARLDIVQKSQITKISKKLLQNLLTYSAEYAIIEAR